MLFASGNSRLDIHVVALIQNKVEVDEQQSAEILQKKTDKMKERGLRVLSILKENNNHKCWTNSQLADMCSWFKPDGFPAIPSKKSALWVYWTNILSSTNSHQISKSYVENQLHDIMSTDHKEELCNEDEDANVPTVLVDQDDNDDDVNVCAFGDSTS